MTGIRLNQYRKNRGVSISHIARKLHKSPAYVHQILHAKRKPKNLHKVIKKMERIINGKN